MPFFKRVTEVIEIKAEGFAEWFITNQDTLINSITNRFFSDECNR